MSPEIWGLPVILPAIGDERALREIAEGQLRRIEARGALFTLVTASVSLAIERLAMAVRRAESFAPPADWRASLPPREREWIEALIAARVIDIQKGPIEAALAQLDASAAARLGGNA